MTNAPDTQTVIEEEYARQDWLDTLDEELEQELDDGRLDTLVDDENGEDAMPLCFFCVQLSMQISE